MKDVCSQGLFHRVLREEISLAKLVRMKPEELVSKELSVWKERPTKPVSAGGHGCWGAGLLQKPRLLAGGLPPRKGVVRLCVCCLHLR